MGVIIPSVLEGRPGIGAGSILSTQGPSYALAAASKEQIVTVDGDNIDKESVEAATKSDAYRAPESWEFPTETIRDQPSITFRIEEFQGPKFKATNRRPITVDHSRAASAIAVKEDLKLGDSVSYEGAEYDVLNSNGIIAPVPGSFITIPSSETILQTIKLFLPHQVNEQYGLSWSQGEVGFAGQAYEEGIYDSFESIYNQGGAWSEVLGNLLARATGTEAMKALPLKSKHAMAVNPHLESFFKGVQFRKFTYNFQLSPKNSREAQNIKGIIRAFKVAAAPSSPDSGLYGRYWKYPKHFRIQYSNENQTHKIKKCFLESISVNYGAAGVNQQFADGTPLQTDLTLNFTELDLVQMEDFKNGY